VRGAIAGIALVFVCALGFLTVYVTVRNGPDILTVASVIVLGLLGFGILGALGEPPDRRR